MLFQDPKIQIVELVRDRQGIPRILFIFYSRKRGDGVEPSENTKLEKKRRKIGEEGWGSNNMELEENSRGLKHH